MRISIVIAGGLAAAWCGLSAMAAAPAQTAKKTNKPAPKKVTRPAPKPAAPPVGKAVMPASDQTAAAPDLSPEVVQFFEKEIRPVLASDCYACHGDKVRQASLRVDSRAALLKGGDKGPSLVPGHPEKSLLNKALNHDGLKMPPGRKLSEKQIAAFDKWVRMGAPWPGESAQVAAEVNKTWDDLMKERLQLWSLQPLRTTVLPVVRNKNWSKHPIDLYVLSSLEKKGLSPAPKADRRALIRRVYLTLLGLPPTPQEVEQFVNDPSPNAYERLVDRALASPHFGERWARHWMDVVRYGETYGYEWNYDVRDAWRYRDYLIRAFNQDVPYDQFIREHIAGDLLPNPRINREEQIDESRIATAFYRFGEVGHDAFKEIGLDTLDNQIDTLSKAFQATTISCARCHDHKLDAISIKDYYSVPGILASSRQVVHTLDAPGVNETPKQKLRDLKAPLRKELAALWGVEAREAGRYMLAAQAERAKAANAAELKQGLDDGRLKVWLKVLEELEKKKPGLEHPLFAWTTVAAKPDAMEETWRQLSVRYDKEGQENAQFNQANFQVVADFGKNQFEGWWVDGLGLRDGVSRSGEFAVASDGDKAVTGVYPAGFFTHVLSEKLNGSLVSPDVPIKEVKAISAEVLGQKSSAVRTVPDFRHLTDTNHGLRNDSLYWTRMGWTERDDHVYMEIVTKHDNQRFPERGGGDKGKAFDDPRSYFGVTKVVLHKTDAAGPKDELSRYRRLFEGADPQTLAAVAERYASVFAQVVANWEGDRTTDDDARWLNWLIQEQLLSNSVQKSPKLSELVTQYREIEKQIRPARVVAGMADSSTPVDVPIHLRGDFRTLGDLAPRRYIDALCETPGRISESGSGRLELAELIASKENPLTARVMVNRVWHYLFGSGLVRTMDDFGHMGEQPSHPELLDYLSQRFIHGGWSVKRLVRSLVLTETFQQASQGSERGKQVDPQNRLLHHFPARRGEAEVIRDSILAASGRLDRTLYGPSIEPFREAPSPERRLYPGTLDGEGRRSIYTRVTLMEAPKFLAVFNMPEGKIALGRRDVTNVPAQALTLMNHQFVIKQAEFWADRLITEDDATPAARIDRMFRLALARAPKASESERFLKMVSELAALHEAPADQVLKHREVWKDVAHAIYNLKEFIYIP